MQKRIITGLTMGEPGGIASEITLKVWKKYHTNINPFFYIGNLRIAHVSFGQGKIITDGSAADFHPSQKRVSAQGDEVVACDIVAKKVTGQLGAIAAVIGTEVDELEHVNGLGLYLAHFVFLKSEK